MKVRLLCCRVGADFVQNRGDEVEVDKDEGLRMIEAGQAVEVGKKETATNKAKTEKAAE